MRTQKSSNLKPVVNFSTMADMLNLSTSRCYQLLDAGILPKPVYCTRTKRPLYTEELQQRCLEIKETNIGANNQYILFYVPRNKSISPKKIKTTNINPVYQEFAETLSSMGLDITPKEVEKAVSDLYPDGIDGKDHGLIIRDLFRKLKSN